MEQRYKEQKENLKNFGKGGSHPQPNAKYETKEYGKCVLIASAIIIAVVIVYLLIVVQVSQEYPVNHPFSTTDLLLHDLFPVL